MEQGHSWPLRRAVSGLAFNSGLALALTWNGGLAFTWSRVRAGLYIDEGQGLPLHGAGSGLAFTWSRVRASLTWSRARDYLLHVAGSGLPFI
jgi:hypothetical protein